MKTTEEWSKEYKAKLFSFHTITPEQLTGVFKELVKEIQEDAIKEGIYKGILIVREEKRNLWEAGSQESNAAIRIEFALAKEFSQ